MEFPSLGTPGVDVGSPSLMSSLVHKGKNRRKPQMLRIY